jgi:hypothetical protein
MGADPFAEAPAAEADPFAESAGDPADEVAAETPAEETPAEDIPVVNAEGERIDAPAADGSSEVADALAAEAAAEPTPEPEPGAEEAQDPPEAAAAPESAAEAPQEGDEAETPAQPAVAAEEPQEGAQAAAQPPVEPQGQTPPADTPPPATGPRGGKGEMRYYKVLYQTGPKQWTEFDLAGVGDPLKQHITTQDGEAWLLARNNEHAVRLAFAVVGSPEQGATVFPVPKGAYKPKRVKPAAPKPERTRLEIS